MEPSAEMKKFFWPVISVDNDGNGGNYELQSSSPYKNKGTDGKDLGADIVALQAALAGVE